MGLFGLFKNKKEEKKQSSYTDNSQSYSPIERGGSDMMNILGKLMAIAWTEFQIKSNEDLIACALVSPICDRANGSLKAKLMIESSTEYERFINTQDKSILKKSELGHDLWKAICTNGIVLEVAKSDIKKLKLIVDGKDMVFPYQYKGKAKNVSIILPYKLEKYPKHVLMFSSYEKGNFKHEKLAPQFLIEIWNTACTKNQ